MTGAPPRESLGGLGRVALPARRLLGGRLLPSRRVPGLFGPAGEDYFLCHFQFAKRGWPKGNATFLDALRLATRPTFTTPKHGAWFRESERGQIGA